MQLKGSSGYHLPVIFFRFRYVQLAGLIALLRRHHTTITR